jgi:sterol 3beta-glucosyltransferase
MRAVLTNFGTTGDIQPFLALAVELRQRGHEPLIAISPYFQSRVEKLGLEFTPVGPDLQKFQQSVMIAQNRAALSFERMRSLFAPLIAALPQMFVDLRDACSGADVLISGAVQPAARMAHETTGIPFVSVQLAHFGGGGTQAFQQASALPINQFRARLGLPSLANPITTDANSSQLALYASSRHVHPVPSDWPPHYHMTGYFFLDEENWQPDDSLMEFLEAGEPPVVVTFGSITYEDTDRLTEIVLEAIDAAACRAVIQHGWTGLGKGKKLPPHVYASSYVPHGWLFPRAACVVHHGGAGTAASVFRAGVPSIFMTRPGGQPLRARLAQELGCAGPAIPYRELTAGLLGAALKETLNTASYNRAAVALGQKIRMEKGVEKGRELIEQLVLKDSNGLLSGNRNRPSAQQAQK